MPSFHAIVSIKQHHVVQVSSRCVQMKVIGYTHSISRVGVMVVLNEHWWIIHGELVL